MNRHINAFPKSGEDHGQHISVRFSTIDSNLEQITVFEIGKI
jgi:hypothetical protein